MKNKNKLTNFNNIYIKKSKSNSKSITNKSSNSLRRNKAKSRKKSKKQPSKKNSSFLKMLKDIETVSNIQDSNVSKFKCSPPKSIIPSFEFDKTKTSLEISGTLKNINLNKSEIDEKKRKSGELTPNKQICSASDY